MFKAKISGSSGIKNFFIAVNSSLINAKTHLEYLKKHHSEDSETICLCQISIDSFKSVLGTEDITLRFSNEIIVDSDFLADMVFFEREK